MQGTKMRSREMQATMNQILGLLMTGVSVLLAAITSGLRLKPYMDAGVEHTPMSFAVYPAAVALVVTVPIVFLLRWWQGKRNVDIGPVTFVDNSLFVVLGCLVYIVVAVTFFPFEPSATLRPAHQGAPHSAPLPGTNISVF
ncbi:MAG: hypothetical protein HOP18_26475 [Deltaproteobacteria bacterium]|nr:hypothetical protein [Deltaproteobacteria bacterium]